MSKKYNNNSDEFFVIDWKSWSPKADHPGLKTLAVGSEMPQQPPGWGWFPDVHNPSTWKPPSGHGFNSDIGELPEPPEPRVMHEPNFEMRITPSEQRTRQDATLTFTIHLRAIKEQVNVKLSEYDDVWPSPGQVTFERDEIFLRAGEPTTEVATEVYCYPNKPNGYYSVGVAATEERGATTLVVNAWVGITMSDKILGTLIDTSTQHERGY